MSSMKRTKLFVLENLVSFAVHRSPGRAVMGGVGGAVGALGRKPVSLVVRVRGKLEIGMRMLECTSGVVGEGLGGLSLSSRSRE